jgi:hypothetical protein
LRESHWLESAEILSRIRRYKGYDANKLRELAFDVLIASLPETSEGFQASGVALGKWLTYRKGRC